MTPPGPVSTGTESPAVAAAEAGTVAPVRVSDVEAVSRSRLLKVGVDTLLVDVAARLSSAQISVVVVCDAQDQPLGTITETLLVRRLGLGQADFFATTAGAVMSRDFAACAPAEMLADVLARMHEQGLIHVLVVNARKQVSGILNARDGLRALLAAGNQEGALLRSYIMGGGYQ